MRGYLQMPPRINPSHKLVSRGGLTMSKRTKTLAQFVEEAVEVHGTKYDYSKVQYVNNHTKVIIVCSIHGEFEQTPKSHLRGYQCNKCTKEASRLTTEEFITRAVKVHGDQYDYSGTTYKDMKNKVSIICPIHGKFTQNPYDHLQGRGCRKCGGTSPLTTEEFIERAKRVHKDKYNYSKSKYKLTDIKMEIMCPKHGSFWQSAHAHLNGSGCSVCKKGGFDTCKPGILYYLKITTEDNQELYKIGITNRTVQERFNLTDLQKIEIVKQRRYENGQDAYDKEQEILKKYEQYKYNGPNVLESGNTELFTVDIREIKNG